MTKPIASPSPATRVPSHDPRRRVPSVERILQALGEVELPRPHVLAIVRETLQRLREARGERDFAAVLADVRNDIASAARARLQGVINATGVILHTNLGRAPLAERAIAALNTVAAGYTNLEFDLAAGARGGRASYLERSLALVCEAEAATVANNCAAALILVLRHFTRQRREVILSRGELVQIGGGFRIPEILEASGAILREVGTTNQTTLDDYARAIGPQTGLLLKVHRSNFFMDGFVSSPPTEALVGLARAHGVPIVEDLGSGAVFATELVGPLDHEPTPAEVLGRGVDLVTFSGDKLFGGPQAGIVAGRAALIAALKNDPLFRALRCDKLVFAALEATTDIHLAGRAAAELPLLVLLRTPLSELRDRAERMAADLSTAGVETRLIDTVAQIGAGSLPRAELPSLALELTPTNQNAMQLSHRLLRGRPPVVGLVSEGRCRLDLRTVFPREDKALVEAIRAAWIHG